MQRREKQKNEDAEIIFVWCYFTFVYGAHTSALSALLCSLCSMCIKWRIGTWQTCDLIRRDCVASRKTYFFLVCTALFCCDVAARQTTTYFSRQNLLYIAAIQTLSRIATFYRFHRMENFFIFVLCHCRPSNLCLRFFIFFREKSCTFCDKNSTLHVDKQGERVRKEKRE